MKKCRSWTPEEDQMLIKFHQQATCFQRWKFISKKFKENRIFKTQFQCRDRYVNHVDPSLKHERLSNEQITKLFTLYDQYGPCWSFFQSKIIGRSQSLLKNKFYSTIRTLLRHFIEVSQKRNQTLEKIRSSTLPTKLISDLYDGKNEFAYVKNLLRNCMKRTNYIFQWTALQKEIKRINPQIVDDLIKILQRNIKVSQKLGKQSKKTNYQQIISNYQQGIFDERDQFNIQNTLIQPPINSPQHFNQYEIQNKQYQQKNQSISNLRIIPVQTYWNFNNYNICLFYI